MQQDETLLRSRIDGLIESVADAGRLEVVHDLAAQLPSRLTADLLGFPEDRWEDIKCWSERLMRIDAVPFDNEALMGAITAIRSSTRSARRDRRRAQGCPADDLISVWADGRRRRRSTMMHETGLFIAGGAETPAR